jgi:hypothetical protein
MLPSRKRAIYLLLILLCISTIFAPMLNKMPVSPCKPASLESCGTKEEQKSLIDSYLPSIKKASDDFYKDYLKISPTVAEYDIIILNIEPVGQECKIVFRTRPFIGPHLGIGTDEIAFLISKDGEARLDTFSHIESEDLPSYLQNILIKPLPPGNDP